MSQSGNMKREIKTNINISIDKIDKIVEQYNQLFIENNKTSLKMTTEPKQIFAQIVKKTKLQEQNTKHVLTITPKDNTTSSAETRKELKSKVNPTDLQVGISRVQNISKGGLLIECDTREEVNKLSKELTNIFSNKMEIKIPEKKKPKLIIYNISNGIEAEEIERGLIKQYTAITGTTTKGKINFRFFTKSKNPNLRNAVIEVTPLARKTLLNFGKVYIGWSRCTINDFISITRCFNCLGFGHIAKYCTQTQLKCSNCAGDHKHSDCNSSDTHKTCLNCIQLNLRTRNFKLHVDTKHSAINNNCHCYKYQKIQTI